jgi:hypothetical protein
MTAPAALAFPGGRAVAGWWRQLSPFRPRQLWVSHLLLHQVEALVRVSRPHRPDPFHALILKALALGPATPAALDDRLHLGRQVLGRVLRGLGDAGLAADDGGRWSLTPAGSQAAEQGESFRSSHERRTFTFVAAEDRDRPPRFIGVAAAGPGATPARDAREFDVRDLQAASPARRSGSAPAASRRTCRRSCSPPTTRPRTALPPSPSGNASPSTGRSAWPSS